VEKKRRLRDRCVILVKCYASPTLGLNASTPVLWLFLNSSTAWLKQPGIAELIGELGGLV